MHEVCENKGNFTLTKSMILSISLKFQTLQKF